MIEIIALSNPNLINLILKVASNVASAYLSKNEISKNLIIYGYFKNVFRTDFNYRKVYFLLSLLLS